MPLKRVLGLLVLMASTFLVSVTPGFGQNTTTGAIAGVVVDSTGAVLPGVTVEVASPALIEKTRAAVTDSQGQYKVVDLRPGTYSVTLTLSGFATVKREGIELIVNSTAAINGEMHAGTVTETVTVTAASPVVDVQNVGTQAVLTRELIDQVPTTQSLLSVSQVTLGMIPTASGSTGLAADVGGNKGEQISSMAVHGGNQADQISTVDGLSIQHTLATGSGFFRLFFINPLMSQETVVVSTSGASEVQTAGVQINMVPKSGSNTWRLDAIANGTNQNLEARNLTPYLMSRGVLTPPSVNDIYNLSFGVGGPIVKDKLWVYASEATWGATEFVASNWFNSTNGTFTYTPNLSQPATRPSPNEDISVNFTWQPSPGNRITIYPMFENNCNCRRGVDNNPPTAPEGSEMGYFKPLVNLLTRWTHPVSDHLFIEGGFIYVNTHANYSQAPEVLTGSVPVTDSTTGIAYTSRVDTALNIFHDPQGNGNISMSYITGTHSLKVGFSLLRGYLDQSAASTSTLPLAYTVKNNAAGTPAPSSITEYALPGHQHDDVSNMGLFVQDQWTMKHRLTLNYGVRYDALHSWAPAQTRPAGYFTPAYSFPEVDNVPNWKDINPRVGAAYDLFANGKTALKFSLGRYVEAESLTIAAAANPVNAIVTNTTRTWTDPSFNPLAYTSAYTPPCNLLNPAANGGCAAISNRLFGTPGIATTYAANVTSGWDTRPDNWQLSAGVDQQLQSGVGLKLFYYRTWYQNLPVTRNTAVPQTSYSPYCITLPVDAALPGGGGNQLCGLYDVNPQYFGQTVNQVMKASAFGNPSQVYNGFDLSVNARLPHGIFLVGGVSDGQTVTSMCFIVNSPADLRNCQVTIPWRGQLQVKATVIYPLPFWGIRLSAVYQDLAGVPIAATSYAVSNSQISPSLGRNLAACGTATVCTATTSITNLFAPDTEFENRLQQLDFRTAKVFKVGHGSVTMNLDLYNLFNANTILNRNNTFSAPPSTTWGTPTDILAPRLFKAGVQISF